MSDAALMSEVIGIPPLDAPERLILSRFEVNPDSKTARILSHALRLSIAPVNSEAPEESMGPNDIVELYKTSGIVERYERRVSLKTLNEYKVILSKREGCEMLVALGVNRLRGKENFLNRYLSERVYESTFGRSPSSISGKGKNKLLFTYSEIVYFYTELLDNSVPDPLPSLPNSLVDYANEIDDYLETGGQ